LHHLLVLSRTLRQQAHIHHFLHFLVYV
jgi:hypothetical protein